MRSCSIPGLKASPGLIGLGMNLIHGDSVEGVSLKPAAAPRNCAISYITGLAKFVPAVHAGSQPRVIQDGDQPRSFGRPIKCPAIG